MAIPSFENHPEINPRQMLPEEASTLPNPLKRLYFNRLVIEHPRMAEILKKLSKMTLPESGFDIVLLIGPTGVGKTEILKEIIKGIQRECKDEMMADPGFIPVIGIEIPEPGPRQFAWSALYTALLAQLNDPLINQKVETLTKDCITSIKPRSTGSSSVMALQMALKSGLSQAPWGENDRFLLRGKSYVPTDMQIGGG